MPVVLGVPQAVPEWVLALDAANGDPLRAREIFEQVDERWWTYHMIYREAQADAQKEQERKRGR